MPSTSEKQKKLMTIASHNKAFADKVGIDQKVAKEFHEADKKIAANKKSLAPKMEAYKLPDPSSKSK